MNTPGRDGYGVFNFIQLMIRYGLVVFLGSGLGGLCRWIVSMWISRLTAGWGSSVFPWGTLVVNVTGCFIIGALYGIPDNAAMQLDEKTKLLIGAGFCGGLTTFSTFTHEKYLLCQSERFPLLALYAAVSLLLGFAAAWAGHSIVR